jgi:hypothetical protein
MLAHVRLIMCVSARGEQERRVKNAGGYVVNIGGVHRVTNAAGAGAGLNLKVSVFSLSLSLSLSLSKGVMLEGFALMHACA